MKFAPLLVANLRRKAVRTVLTTGSFAVSLFLFGLLGAIHFGLRQGVDQAGADRLVVIGRTSIIQPLPATYAARILRIAGVRDVAQATWFGGIYQDPKNFFPQYAVVPAEWRRMFPEFRVDPAEWRAFEEDRQGVVVGKALAARFGWKVGDHIPLKAPSYFGGGGWDFNVRGIYEGTRPGDDESQFWLQHDYVHEKAPQFWSGLVGWYWVRIDSPDRALAVSKAIDAEFANSSSETRSQTESAFASAFIAQMGNIEFLILAIGSVVLFTLLLVTGNTMAIAVRERTGELAVLKAMGFTDLFVLGIVLVESLTIAIVGGVVGLWLARAVVLADITGGVLPLLLPARALAGGVALALATGALAGLLPALGAMRLQVVEALRRV